MKIVPVGAELLHAINSFFVIFRTRLKTMWYI